MKLTQLRNLRAVADAGSVRQASRDLNLSQSAITKSIQMLEAELDTKLLHRASHGVSTTASGEALVARAGIIESELKNARDDIARIDRAWHIRVGSGGHSKCSAGRPPIGRTRVRY